MYASWGRFFITGKSSFSLAPHQAQQADIIAFFLGNVVPLLLRRERDRYCIIGQMRVQGLMKGEILEQLVGTWAR